jgi:RNase P subunit RPR2
MQLQRMEQCNAQIRSARTGPRAVYYVYTYIEHSVRTYAVDADCSRVPYIRLCLQLVRTYPVHVPRLAREICHACSDPVRTYSTCYVWLRTHINLYDCAGAKGDGIYAAGGRVCRLHAGMHTHVA